MSKWHNEGKPVDRGPWAGCLRVRWRPSREASSFMGYLPGDQPRLKDAYDDYERRCWVKHEVPNAPEVHFAEQMKRFLDARNGRAEVVREEVEKNALAKMTLRKWVGTEKERGPFWECTPRAKGAMQEAKYFGMAAWLGDLADKPMSELKSEQIIAVFYKHMACTECVVRATAAGKVGGVDVAWSTLVPFDGVDTFDGAACEAHHAAWTRSTYEGRRQIVRALWHAALTDTFVEKYGRHALASYNPAPKPNQLRMDDIAFQSSEGEELRCGLSEVQIQLITDASPARYRAIPFAAAFTLNRGGQELTGMRIRDFSWVLTEDGRKVGCIELRNFHRLLRNGRRVMSKKGKTPKAARTVFIPAFVGRLIEEYIEEFRSTPSVACKACVDGERHWGGPMRDDPDRNPHKGCDFAADAPLWVRENGKCLDPAWHVKNVWHPACEQAGLTEENLGWKPQVKHSRSTGTTLHLLYGTDRAEVVRLGGWTSTQMIDEHYEKLRKSTRAQYATRFDSVVEGDGLEFQNRRLQMEVERLRALCVAAGFDPDARVTPIDEPGGRLSAAPRVTKARPSKFADAGQVVKAVIEAAAAGQAPSAVIVAMGAAPAKKNYQRLAKVCAEAGIPALSTGKYLPNGTRPVEVNEWAEKVTTWAASRATAATA
ncbi:MAG: hypothetical protein F2735_00470 [Actinobacteria bacterium]|uniref:Unannotated protein n=1 Tax=freshwater metagenome TaxID=449393 RepID=A0A6J6WTA7_9ZZZZ|nr:hypothetical protein [Actinomycetota bacterium]